MAWIKFRRLRRGQNMNSEFKIIQEYLANASTQFSQMFSDSFANDCDKEIPSLTPEEVQKLPRKICNTENNCSKEGSKGTCPVCCDDFQEGEEIYELPECKHEFHPCCIDSWFTKSILCPMCRSNVKENLLACPTVSSTA